MVAVEQYGYCLSSIPPDKQTAEICIAAIRASKGGAVPYVHPSQLTREVREIADEFGTTNYSSDFISFGTLSQIEITEVIKRFPSRLRYLPLEKRTHKLCLEAVRREWPCLEYVPKTLQTSEICLAAIRQKNSAAVLLLHPDLG